MEHWGLINFNFDVKNYNFNSIMSSIDQSINHLEAKLDAMVEEKNKADPNSENDPYMNNVLSLTRRIR